VDVLATGGQIFLDGLAALGDVSRIEMAESLFFAVLAAAVSRKVLAGSIAWAVGTVLATMVRGE
jgi:hypothetical protein